MNARSNHSSVRAPSLPAGMYLCVEPTFRSVPCADRSSTGEVPSPGIVARIAPLLCRQRLVMRMSLDSIVHACSDLRHLQVPVDAPARSSGSRNMRGSSKRTSCAAIRHSPPAWVICTAPLNPLAPGARCTGSKDKSSTRVCSEYFGGLAASSRSNCEADFAECAGRVHGAQSREPLALRQIRQQRPQGVEDDTIGLAARLDVAVSCARPLGFDARSQPRCSRPRHVQIRDA